MSDAWASDRYGLVPKNIESQTTIETYGKVAPVAVTQLNLCQTQATKEGSQRQERQHRRPDALKKTSEHYQYA